MKYACCELRRLDVLRAAGNPAVNAIEYLEVLDRGAPASVPRQRTLLVRMLRPGFTFGPGQIVIDGGDRIQRVGVVWAAPGDALPAAAEPALVGVLATATDDPSRTLVIRTESAGDFSRYMLRLVSSPGSVDPPNGVDPILSRVEFSFKVECPSPFDCEEERACPPVVVSKPPIDYLAKDYAGFRRLLLDRMSLLTPEWTERSPADVGIALVELLAYAADNLSYRQDAVANEAYLGTAQKRVSIRRHARLVDYRMHDGCNARAWVQVQVRGGNFELARGTPVYTRTHGVDSGLTPVGPGVERLRAVRALVFETARTQVLDERCNRMSFYTWGDDGCCLPVGSTSATLRGRPPLAVGDVLMLEEVASPTSAADLTAQADADRSRRWAVRLIAVDGGLQDPSGGLFENPPNALPVDLTRIEWDRADALPFALCLSTTAHPGRTISVASGNFVLADHGQTMPPETLASVPAATRRFVPAARAANGCQVAEGLAVPVRYRPHLSAVPVTNGFDLAVLLDPLPDQDEPPFWPASQLLPLDVRRATARVVLQRQGRSETWSAVQDLLGSSSFGTQFVVETEHDGRSRLRFGDDRHGLRPNEGDIFLARYRVGNGTVGNVGAESLSHVLVDPAVYAANAPVAVMPDATRVIAVRNPLAAVGGVDPEDAQVVRRDAPEAFRTQERAVTPSDYEAAAERSGEVQRAAATFRWTGSWHTVFVTADRHGGADVDAPFERRLRRHLERFRMAGYDLEVDAPRSVPLQIVLHICVAPGHFREPVLRAVQQRLSAERQVDGTRGLFHPNEFSFGDPVYLSRIVAATQAIEGVEAVRVERFGRQGDTSLVALENGAVEIGRLEIAQLANDPNFPERGLLKLVVGGGQ